MFHDSVHSLFVTCLWNTQLNSQGSAFELLSVHCFYCLNSLFFSCEFDETKPSVLISSLLQRYTNIDYFTKFSEACLEMLFPQIEAQVSNDNLSLLCRWWSLAFYLRLPINLRVVWEVAILSFNIVMLNWYI